MQPFVSPFAPPFTPMALPSHAASGDAAPPATATAMPEPDGAEPLYAAFSHMTMGPPPPPPPHFASHTHAMQADAAPFAHAWPAHAYAAPHPHVALATSVPVPVPMPLTAPPQPFQSPPHQQQQQQQQQYVVPSAPASSSDLHGPLTPPPDAHAWATERDADAARRAAGAAGAIGLDVSAPEFVPSFAAASPPAASASSPAQHLPSAASSAVPHIHATPHPLSPPDEFDVSQTLPNTSVYANVPRPMLLPSAAGGEAMAMASFLAHQVHALHEEQSPAQAVSHFDADFPRLHVANGAGSSERASQASAAAATAAAAMQAAAMQAAAATAAAQVTNDMTAGGAAQGGGMADAALEEQALAWSRLQREEAAKRTVATTAMTPAMLQAYEMYDEDDELFADEEAIATSGDVGTLWVSTGQSVATLYQTLRSEAGQEARSRNKLFDRALVAFRKGDGAGAKKYSELGRMANVRMKELHGKAADAIFEARNPPNVVDVVDLHGLHVSEAVERLPGALARGAGGKVRVLTGSGHHTKGTGRARLRPAVMMWLQENGYTFEQVVDANEYVGSFIVDVNR